MIIVDPGRRCRELLLPIFDVWLDRLFGRLNYFLTQFFTGHECFNAFLHRIGKVPGAECPYCGVPIETPTHAVFNCYVWSAYRGDLPPTSERDLAGDQALVRRMLQSEVEWARLSDTVSTIVMLRKDGRQFERLLLASQPSEVLTSD
ncbi:hypothetical protein DMN91_012147 [Ooceraea biroi]|uniref:Reverse transcriptase zinc-binding domain-containing protein n=1 Tax=Ooceraea biroi TaxID=2015173 RepID=A0A3L8D565_OOCBI|nr:uncharacterized protein LOC105281487 [Ooceraea biroi]RLU15153.1 hypothetical protein DMN91_012147 [Ooceraea biroi]